MQAQLTLRFLTAKRCTLSLAKKTLIIVGAEKATMSLITQALHLLRKAFMR